MDPRRGPQSWPPLGVPGRLAKVEEVVEEEDEEEAEPEEAPVAAPPQRPQPQPQPQEAAEPLAGAASEEAPPKQNVCFVHFVHALCSQMHE